MTRDSWDVWKIRGGKAAPLCMIANEDYTWSPLAQGSNWVNLTPSAQAQESHLADAVLWEAGIALQRQMQRQKFTYHLPWSAHRQTWAQVDIVQVRGSSSQAIRNKWVSRSAIRKGTGRRLSSQLAGHFLARVRSEDSHRDVTPFFRDQTPSSSVCQDWTMRMLLSQSNRLSEPEALIYSLGLCLSFFYSGNTCQGTGSARC
jgi:hypothetical protein